MMQAYLIQIIDTKQYFDDNFIKTVQNRGGQVLQMGKQSAVISAAYAISDLLKNLYFGLPENSYTSLGVYSFGKLFEIPEGIFFAQPCKLKGNFKYEVDQNF